jgi:hypothetical protein
LCALNTFFIWKRVVHRQNLRRKSGLWARSAAVAVPDRRIVCRWRTGGRLLRKIRFLGLEAANANVTCVEKPRLAMARVKGLRTCLIFGALLAVVAMHCVVLPLRSKHVWLRV